MSGDAGRETDPTVRARLGTASHPLVTTEPGADAADLAALDLSARVVGLGEATHGGRAVFRLKARLLRHLVREHGHRVLAVEAPVPATQAVEDYVVRGEGDPREALADTRWMWAVESVLALVEWLRAFNEGRPAADRVRVRGVDVPYTAGPARAVRDYLDRVDPAFEAGAGLETLADGLRRSDTPGGHDDLGAALSATEGVPARLADRLERRQDEYVAASSRRAFERAERSAWALARARRTVALSHEEAFGGAAVRERSMATAVERAVAAVDAPGVYWAHNAHVGRGDWVWRSDPATGQHLTERLGSEYLPVGTAFARGTVRAQDPDTDGDRPRTWSVGDPPADSLPAALAAVTADGDAGRLLDTRAIEDPDLAAWLATERPRRCVGSVAPEGGTKTVTDAVAERFDAVAAVTETDATVPFAVPER